MRDIGHVAGTRWVGLEPRGQRSCKPRRSWQSRLCANSGLWQWHRHPDLTALVRRGEWRWSARVRMLAMSRTDRASSIATATSPEATQLPYDDFYARISLWTFLRHCHPTIGGSRQAADCPVEAGVDSRLEGDSYSASDVTRPVTFRNISSTERPRSGSRPTMLRTSATISSIT